MSEPNIVPLIDVLLVLIIIFMAITPTTPTGMDTRVPQPASQKVLPSNPLGTIVVVVGADGNVMINQTPTTWNDLGSRLSDIFKIRADKTAFVKGDDDAEFTYVARAIDIMRGSGITNVGLITAKMEAGQ
ncbi:MAG TPA: biopolymer transporter ExbD [Candidatus Acidoferrales bacterium]|nr:biopolymer transporter ExbD [Candidatus Acidoferrales bacterium]